MCEATFSFINRFFLNFFLFLGLFNKLILKPFRRCVSHAFLFGIERDVEFNEKYASLVSFLLN